MYRQELRSSLNNNILLKIIIVPGDKTSYQWSKRSRKKIMLLHSILILNYTVAVSVITVLEEVAVLYKNFDITFQIHPTEILTLHTSFFV